jgi:hypothetical protein
MCSSWSEARGLALTASVCPTKVERVAHIHWPDVPLSQLERELGPPGRGIGIEARIEGRYGLSEIEAIAFSKRPHSAATSTAGTAGRRASTRCITTPSSSA